MCFMLLCISCWKGLGKGFGSNFDSVLNDFEGHVGMIFLVLLILFQYSVQIMRSLCHEECEANVSIILQSRCQSECEADVSMNAKPMSG